MGKSAPFRLNGSGLLLALVSSALAGQSHAAAGRVDFATGGATISKANGQRQPLAKGAELDSGDTIRTDAGGRAQIRFPDGAYVSLQPNTEFSIKEYNFDGKTDGSERGFFALAKGAMRTVTGLIGRVNKNRYQVSTPTATIGIRGTGGLISVLNDGSTLVNGTSGIWTISNPSGTIDVPAGTAGKAPAAPNQPPQQTTEKPSTGPTQPPTTQPPYTQADQRAPDGTSTAVATPPIVPLQSGSGYSASIAPGPYSPDPVLMSPADAIFNASGQLTDIKTGSFFQFTLGASGSHADFGTDGILAWGRWVGQVDRICDCTSPVVYGPNQGLHYVVGMPTPVMPTSGTGTYAMYGATSPTFADGSAAPGTLNSATLMVTFGATTSIDASLNVSIGGRGYSAAGTTTTSLSTFSMSMATTGTGGACSGCGCFTSANGFFSGANAERAGLAYTIYDNSQTVNGAAALKKQ